MTMTSTFVKQAWRNLFRHTRRTVLSGSLVGLGLAALMLFDAFMLGMEDRMIASSTVLGQALLHHRDFATSREVEKTIVNAEAAQALLSQDPAVAAWAPRTVAMAMASSADNARPVLLYGMEPVREKALSRLDEMVTAGNFLDRLGEHELLMGSEAARSLRLALGDKTVLTLTQAGTGALAQDVFRVGGILHTGIESLDKTLVILPIARTQELLGLGPRIHEIAFRFHRIEDASTRRLPLWNSLSARDNHAAGWPELLPDLRKMLEVSDLGLGIMAGILGAIVGIGVLNTLFMAIFERTWELGVMRAIGTRQAQVIHLIVLEAASLAAVSVVAGALLGAAAIGVLGMTGLDFGGAEFGGATLNGLLYPRMRLRQFVLYPPLVFLFTVAISLYPAWVASRIAPASAMARKRT